MLRPVASAVTQRSWRRLPKAVVAISVSNAPTTTAASLQKPSSSGRRMAAPALQPGSR